MCVADHVPEAVAMVYCIVVMATLNNIVICENREEDNIVYYTAGKILQDVRIYKGE